MLQACITNYYLNVHLSLISCFILYSNNKLSQSTRFHQLCEATCVCNAMLRAPPPHTHTHTRHSNHQNHTSAQHPQHHPNHPNHQNHPHHPNHPAICTTLTWPIYLFISINEQITGSIYLLIHCFQFRENNFPDSNE